MSDTTIELKPLAGRIVCLIIVFIVLSSIIAIAGYNVVYILSSNVSAVGPPIILEPLIPTATVGPNGTSGRAVITAQQQTMDLIRNGDFADGYGAWFYGEYDDDGTAGGGNLRGYWVNGTGYQTPGYVLLGAVNISDGYSGYNYIIENITYPCSSLSQATLDFAYATVAFVYGLTGIFPIPMTYYNITVYLVNWTPTGAQLITLYTTSFIGNTSWTPVSANVAATLSNLKPGTYSIAVVAFYYYTVWLGTGYADMYAAFDDIHLNVTCADYVWSGSIWKVVDRLGAYRVGLKLNSASINGAVNTLSLYVRNGRYITTSISIVNNSITNNETTYIVFNSTDVLTANGTIDAEVSVTNNTVVNMSLELVYYSPITSRAVVVRYPLVINVTTSSTAFIAPPRIVVGGRKPLHIPVKPPHTGLGGSKIMGAEVIDSLWDRYFPYIRLVVDKKLIGEYVGE